MITYELGLYEYIVHVKFHGLENFPGEHLVHKSLVSCIGVLQAKRHDLVARKSLICDEQGVFLIRPVHRDLIITQIVVHDAQ